ncbi:MAG: MoaD/ThiS family protein [Planctomycetales bacterium]|nr:MoaD/ThiS family protein [Planctomycetales bacterium]
MSDSCVVLLFAAARERAGRDRIRLEVALPAPVAQVRGALTEACPELTGLIERCRFAVDNQFVEDEHEVPTGAEVALIPPVSGG